MRLWVIQLRPVYVEYRRTDVFWNVDIMHANQDIYGGEMERYDRHYYKLNFATEVCQAERERGS